MLSVTMHYIIHWANSETMNHFSKKLLIFNYLNCFYISVSQLLIFLASFATFIILALNMSKSTLMIIIDSSRDRDEASAPSLHALQNFLILYLLFEVVDASSNCLLI